MSTAMHDNGAALSFVTDDAPWQSGTVLRYQRPPLLAAPPNRKARRKRAALDRRRARREPTR